MNRSSHMAGPYYVHTKPPVKSSDCQLAISYSPPTQAKFNLELQNRFFKCEEHLVFGTISSLNVVYIKRSVTSHKLSPFFFLQELFFSIQMLSRYWDIWALMEVRGTGSGSVSGSNQAFSLTLFYLNGEHP